MKYFALIVLITVVTQKLYSQDYRGFISKASDAYNDSSYLESGNFYELAFEIEPTPSNGNFYNAACSFSLAKNPKKAIKYLTKAFEARFGDISWAIVDPDFNNINQSLEFKSLIDNYRQLNTIYVDQFLNMLINASESDLVIIEYRKLQLGRYPFNKNYVIQNYKNATYDSGRLVINKSLIIENCTLFDVWFDDFIINGIVIQNSKIERRLGFENAQLSSLILVDNKVVDNQSQSGNYLTVSGSEIGNVYIKNNDIDLSLSECKFKLDPELALIGDGRFRADGVSRKTWNSIIHNNKIDIHSCEFSANSNKEQVILFLRIKSEIMKIYNSQFFCKVSFLGSKFVESVRINSSIFQEYVDLQSVIFPEFNVFIPFNQFKSGLAKFGKENGDREDDWVVSTGKSLAQMESSDRFLELIYTHVFLYNQYRQRGDIESANLAYVSIKDFHLTRLNYLYDKDGGFKNLFRYRLAQIMKFYTNHGTDPSLALLMSFYIILIFAVFYFFFPSEWDTTSKARLISDFRDFRQKNEKGYVKPFIVMLGGFLLSLINALTLSLNSFVTLGFGTIPTKGLARYVCIIQGFIGWFLLSIFTVALINQVLA